MQQSPS